MHEQQGHVTQFQKARVTLFSKHSRNQRYGERQREAERAKQQLVGEHLKFSAAISCVVCVNSMTAETLRIERLLLFR